MDVTTSFFGFADYREFRLNATLAQVMDAMEACDRTIQGGLTFAQLHELACKRIDMATDNAARHPMFPRLRAIEKARLRGA